MLVAQATTDTLHCQRKGLSLRQPWSPASDPPRVAHLWGPSKGSRPGPGRWVSRQQGRGYLSPLLSVGQSNDGK